MKNEIWEWCKSIIFAVVVVFVIQLFIRPTTVVGASMNNTLEDKDMLILQVTKNFEHGDIISFESDLIIRKYDLERIPFYKRFFVNVGDPKPLIKRIIAMPGDTISIQDGIVYLNGEVLDEPYYDGLTEPDLEELTVSEDHYFLMGDNRYNSTDSRKIGVIHKDRIMGKTLIRIWPLSKLGGVE